VAGHPRRRAQAALAHLPDHFLALRVVQQLHLRRARLLLQHRHAAARLAVGVVLAVAAEADEDEALALRHQLDVRFLVSLLLDPVEQQVVQPLQGDRLERQDLHEVVADEAGGGRVGVGGAEAALPPRADFHQDQRRFVPAGRAVRLGVVRRDGVGRDFYGLDRGRGGLRYGGHGAFSITGSPNKQLRRATAVPAQPLAA
jgi:hypothetical protein